MIFKSFFLDVVKLWIRLDVKIGFVLFGGLDSLLIVGVIIKYLEVSIVI